MKKCVSIVLAMLILICSVGCSKKETQSDSTFDKITIEDIEIMKPANWEYKEMKGSYYFYTPENDVILFDIHNDTTEFTQETFDIILSGIESAADKFEITSSEEKFIQTKPIYKAIFNAKANGEKYEGNLIMFRINSYKICTLYLGNYSGVTGYDELLERMVMYMEIKSEEPKQEVVKENKKEGISGSNYVDITLNMKEDLGFPKHTLNGKKSYKSEKTTASGTKLSYTVDATNNSEIKYATFEAMFGYDEATFRKDALNYLKYCVTVPYDSANKELAQQWVEDNINNVVSPETAVEIVIGDAKFELYGTEFVKWIEMKPVE